MQVAVAVSGGGRTLGNLLLRQAEAKIWRVAAVVASKPDCGGVAIARQAGLPCFVDSFKRQELATIGERLDTFFTMHQVDFIALAGFLRPFPILKKWESVIINIHPALLPRHGGQGMYGEHVHAAVLAAGDEESGATIHYVTDQYDEGQIIAQARVPVNPDDTVDTLAARVFEQECELYPRVLTEIARGRS